MSVLVDSSRSARHIVSSYPLPRLHSCVSQPTQRTARISHHHPTLTQILERQQPPIQTLIIIIEYKMSAHAGKLTNTPFTKAALAKHTRTQAKVLPLITSLIDHRTLTLRKLRDTNFTEALRRQEATRMYEQAMCEYIVDQLGPSPISLDTFRQCLQSFMEDVDLMAHIVRMYLPTKPSMSSPLERYDILGRDNTPFPVSVEAAMLATGLNVGSLEGLDMRTEAAARDAQTVSARLPSTRR